jgi:hypothetical protein
MPLISLQLRAASITKHIRLHFVYRYAGRGNFVPQIRKGRPAKGDLFFKGE